MFCGVHALQDEKLQERVCRGKEQLKSETRAVIVSVRDSKWLSVGV